MRDINFHDGSIAWNVLDYHLMDQMKTGQWPGEDLLTIKYEHCVIDVGWYGGEHGCYCVKVIGRNRDITETYIDGSPVEWNWTFPYANIPCLDLDDMYDQLRRAVDIYPKQIKES